MNPERWEPVTNLMHEALQLPPEQRGVFLDVACSSDASLRAELESLLAAREDVRTNFLYSRHRRPAKRSGIVRQCPVGVTYIC
jgi:hypothetical protein